MFSRADGGNDKGGIVKYSLESNFEVFVSNKTSSQQQSALALNKELNMDNRWNQNRYMNDHDQTGLNENTFWYKGRISKKFYYNHLTQEQNVSTLLSKS